MLSGLCLACASSNGLRPDCEKQPVQTVRAPIEAMQHVSPLGREALTLLMGRSQGHQCSRGCCLGQRLAPPTTAFLASWTKLLSKVYTIEPNDCLPGHCRIVSLVEASFVCTNEIWAPLNLWKQAACQTALLKQTPGTNALARTHPHSPPYQMVAASQMKSAINRRARVRSFGDLEAHVDACPLRGRRP